MGKQDEKEAIEEGGWERGRMRRRWKLREVRRRMREGKRG